MRGEGAVFVDPSFTAHGIYMPAHGVVVAAAVGTASRYQYLGRWGRRLCLCGVWRSLRTNYPVKKIIFITARYVRSSDLPKELKDKKKKWKASSSGPQLRVGVEGELTDEPPAISHNQRLLKTR